MKKLCPYKQSQTKAGGALSKNPNGAPIMHIYRYRVYTLLAGWNVNTWW
jgi:hypothetical protein